LIILGKKNMRRALLLPLFCITAFVTSQAQCFSDISSGYGTVVAKKTDGSVWGWGDNSLGQLGGLPQSNYYVSASLPNSGNVLKIFSGTISTFLIKSNGTLWATGGNFNGNLGVNSTSPAITTLVQVGTENNWKEVSGDYFTIAVKYDGTLWAWGQNDGHQMGDGSCCADRLVPGQVGTDTDWQKVEVSGSRSAFAIKTNGTLWVWGTNISGLLGSNVVQSISVPTQFTTDSNWDKVAAGYVHILALKTDGTLWAWGDGTTGGCGDGLPLSYLRSSPHQVISTGTWATMSAGQQFSVGIKTDGTLWAWGQNDQGQLGDGTTTNKSLPEQIGTATNWQSVSCGYVGVAALRTDGSLWTWGDNTYGQLCNGNPAISSSATPYNVPVAGCSLGVNDFDKPTALILSPNPAAESLTVHYDGKASCDRMTIYDLSGRVIYRTDAIGALQFTAALPVGDLQSGTYILALEKGGKRLVSEAWVKE
jgi:hypothetical protein